MRPRILYELSRRLAALLEESLRAGAAGRIPVFLCHPLDPLERTEELEGNAAGILFPVRVTPDIRFRRTGLHLETAGPGGQGESFRLEDLWVKVRYAFLVAGGSLELELEAMAAALRTLHDNPSISLDLEALEAAPLSEVGHEADRAPQGEASFPLTIVEAPDGWRELGLPDHRLVIAFEVTVPIRSERTEPVVRVLERDLEVEGGGA